MADSWEDFYDELYEEADRTLGGGLAGDQDGGDSPLYETLRNIDRRYENEIWVGEGGLKVIYRVHDVRAGRDVALARPRPELPGESYDAFLREAHITAKLEHANVIKLFDMGVEEDGTPFFTMEFKRGKSLHDRLRESRKEPSIFPLEERLQLFLAVCDAISYAHSRRVLHLDLKPENIQVGDYGEVQVCDWGLGEIAIDRTGNVSEGDALLDPDLYGDNGDPRLVRGTPGFMAPEQKKPGEPHTCQTDVFALGKTLALLVGSKNPALSAIVAKATAEAPADRYPSVKALQDDVHRFVTLHPTSVEPGGVAREAWLFVRRHQLSCVIVAIALVATVMLSTWFLTELEIRRRNLVAAEAQAERAISELAVTEREKQVSDAHAEKASDQAETATEMVRAMIEARHADAYAQSLSLLDVPGMDPFNERSLEEAVAVLNEAFEQGKIDRAQLRRQLGYVHFVAQRFDQAAEYYSGLAADPDLQSLIPELRKRMGSRTWLRERDLTRLFRSLRTGPNPRLSLIEKMMVYDSRVLRPKERWEDRVRIALSALIAFNPDWSFTDGIWDQDALALELRGQSLTRLANTKAENRERVTSLLQTLDLNSLTLRNTGVDDLEHLSGMSLLQLELINTTPKSFEPLRDMKSLRILKVDRPELQRQAREQLGKRVLVELTESNTSEGFSSNPD